MKVLILLLWLFIACFWAVDLAMLIINVVGVRILYYQGDILTAAEMLGKRPFIWKSFLLLSLGLACIFAVVHRYFRGRNRG